MDPSAKARQAVFEEWLKWSWERLVIKKWSWQAAPQDRVIRDNHSPSRHTLLSVCLSVWLSSFFKFSPSYLTVVFHACPHWFVTSPLLSLDSVCLITLSRWSNESNWLQITTKSYMHTECSHSVLHPASQKNTLIFWGLDTQQCWNCVHHGRNDQQLAVAVLGVKMPSWCERS